MNKPSFHEDFSRPEKIEASSERSFGLVFAALFTVIALWPLMDGGDVALWSLGIAAAFGILGLVKPVLLLPLNRLWTRLGLLLSKVVTPLILAVLYIFTVVPTGFMLRIFGHDPLRLKFKPGEDTYWIERDPPGPSPDSLSDQF